MKKLLLHICCAPCAIIPIRELSNEFELYAYFFNPNIHPYKEYRDRLDSVKKLTQEASIPLFIDEYPFEDYLRKALCFEGISNYERCSYCYQVRLKKAHTFAMEKQIPLVSTTLLYSKYQQHEQIREIAYEIFSLKASPSFYYRDFRPFFYEGLEQARTSSLYIQKYCGCIFSNQERYLKTSFGNNVIGKK